MDLDPSALIYFADPDIKLKTRNRVEPFVTGTENCNKKFKPLVKKARLQAVSAPQHCPGRDRTHSGSG